MSSLRLPPAARVPVAVLDTSVLVAVWSRVALQTLASGPEPVYQPVWSEWIIAETWRVLTWRWAQRGAKWEEVTASANAMLRHLLPVMRLVSLREAPAALPAPPIADPDDGPIWTTAVLARAHYVVSDNIHDFPPLREEQATIDGKPYRLARHRYQDIEYLTAFEFITDVLGETPAEILGRAVPPAGVVRSQRAVRLRTAP